MTTGKPGPGRTLLIYCDSQQEKESFDELAAERGSSTSRLLLNILREWKAGLQLPRDQEQPDNLADLRDRIAALEEALRHERLLRESSEAEIRRLMAEPYLAEGPLMGQLPTNPELERVLRARPLQDIALLKAMGIDNGDARAVRALTRQLETLEGMGVVKKERNGWRWVK